LQNLPVLARKAPGEIPAKGRVGIGFDNQDVDSHGCIALFVYSTVTNPNRTFTPYNPTLCRKSSRGGLTGWVSPTPKISRAVSGHPASAKAAAVKTLSTMRRQWSVRACRIPAMDMAVSYSPASAKETAIDIFSRILFHFFMSSSFQFGMILPFGIAIGVPKITFIIIAVGYMFFRFSGGNY
jgi:hypothetical protein